jgi:isoleucyl-tRNA synthetase
VQVDGFGELDKDLFVLQNKARPEFVIATENDVTVVLDIELTPLLIQEGMFRELVRVLQVARKEAGFNVEDRIIVHLETAGENLQKVVNDYQTKIMQDVLVNEFTNAGEFTYHKTAEIAGEEIKISIRK